MSRRTPSNRPSPRNSAIFSGRQQSKWLHPVLYFYCSHIKRPKVTHMQQAASSTVDVWGRKRDQSQAPGTSLATVCFVKSIRIAARGGLTVARMDERYRTSACKVWLIWHVAWGAESWSPPGSIGVTVAVALAGFWWCILSVSLVKHWGFVSQRAAKLLAQLQIKNTTFYLTCHSYYHFS